MRVLFDPSAAAGAAITAAVVVDDQPFRVVVHDVVLMVERGEESDSDLRLVADPNTLAALVRGDRTLGAEQAAGHVQLTGDLATAGTFLGCFAPPRQLAQRQM